MIAWIKKQIQTFFNYVWKLFLNGLFTILPITLTVAIFKITISLIITWLEPLRQIVPSYLDVPYGEIIVAVIIIFLVGTVLKVFVLRSTINALESLLIKVPLVRPIYSSIKQLISAFSGKDKMVFREVVLLEFPRKKIYSVGFVTGKLQKKLRPNEDVIYYNIFIPTTPNPTNGYFIVAPKEDLKPINITRQEAMAMIMSGGIVQPEDVICKIKNEEFYE